MFDFCGKLWYNKKLQIFAKIVENCVVLWIFLVILCKNALKKCNSWHFWGRAVPPKTTPNTYPRPLSALPRCLGRPVEFLRKFSSRGRHPAIAQEIVHLHKKICAFAHKSTLEIVHLHTKFLCICTNLCICKQKFIKNCAFAHRNGRKFVHLCAKFQAFVCKKLCICVQKFGQNCAKFCAFVCIFVHLHNFDQSSVRRTALHVNSHSEVTYGGGAYGEDIAASSKSFLL